MNQAEATRILTVLRNLRDAKADEWDAMMASQEGVELSKLWDELQAASKTPEK